MGVGSAIVCSEVVIVFSKGRGYMEKSEIWTERKLGGGGGGGLRC